MARAAGGTYEDTEGLINLPLTVKEILAVVFFKQTEGDEYRVSMRSKGDIDIGAVAKEFGGGGHKNAAGCTVTGPIDALQKTFLEKIERAIDGRPARRRQAVRSDLARRRRARRRVLSERRIGHTGTLDPMASGVLPLVVGRATRLARFLTADDKAYEATIRLGVAPTRATRWAAGRRAVRRSRWPIAAHRGRGARPVPRHVHQQPPAFSAKKIDGQRSYDLARRRGRARQTLSRTRDRRRPYRHLPQSGTAPPALQVHRTLSVEVTGDLVTLPCSLLRRLLRPFAGARPRRSGSASARTSSALCRRAKRPARARRADRPAEAGARSAR